MVVPSRIRVPGRVNLIGDHTDYTDGYVLPMAVDRWTTLSIEPRSGRVVIDSDADPDAVDIAWPPALPIDDARIESHHPRWGRHVLAVADELARRGRLATDGMTGHLTTTIPVGAGLSSSAALDIALALGLGFTGGANDLAQLARAAEHRATGVPVGIMDQLCIATAVAGHLSLIDCGSLAVEPVAVPPTAEIRVLFVAHRELAGSAYHERVEQCRMAEAAIGPLRAAPMAAIEQITDATVRARARHVIGENARVLDMVAALRADDLEGAGRLMIESHLSLAREYEVSIAAMDRAVAELAELDGVYGARMTGGGFGGCVVLLCAAGRAPDVGWHLRPVGGPEID